MGKVLACVEVELGDRGYPIVIGSGLLDDADTIKTFVRNKLAYQQVCVVTNETIAPIYMEQLRSSLTGLQVETCILPDGEKYKNLDTLNQIFTCLLQTKFNRKACLVALGGGVVGDMTGFAAACYQRGIDFIQIPTTLLSQVDSSVGGKTGVNHVLGKNMIGAFKQPKSVVIDIDVLSTLPAAEFAAGMAEVIKYGLIWDQDFFTWLEQNAGALKALEPRALTFAIQKSCEIKAGIVAEDETEQGLRAILNLGHTFGHAIETHAGYGVWLHGQAVAVGMRMAIRMSNWLNESLGEELEARLVRLLEVFELPVYPPDGMNRDDFLTHMAVDKKNLNADIRLVLLDKLGQARVTSEYPMSTLNRLIDSFIGQS
ncbi:3-dehydroquinate synthase [Gynuella sunshinyii]|uniref:3-dehydroquinate synthase n=1 Tax=Gynuella sunshinyii TaxID=1445505 RepID=UPI0005CBB699|nr:3-dehydroquinate synthase [Gynuella sunshinyii]